MKNILLSFLLLLSFACSKKEDVQPINCYKDYYFNTIKGFYCLTAEEAENYAILKRQGKTTLNLTVATDADYQAAPDKLSGCNSCR